MGRALLVVGWLAQLGLVATAVVGYSIEGRGESLALHMLLGLLSTLLLLFSHSWIMFYLIGTGKAIKEAVLENGLESSIVEETRRFKRLSSPWIMLAMLVAMTAFVLGAAAFSGKIPLWLHASFFYLTLGVQGWTLWLEGRILVANERLMIDIDRRLAA